MLSDLRIKLKEVYLLILFGHIYISEDKTRGFKDMLRGNMAQKHILIEKNQHFIGVRRPYTTK